MSSASERTSIPYSQFQQLRSAQSILRQEADALVEVASHLGDDFSMAIESLCACEGRVVVTGVGKAGLIGRKIAATMSSTGTPSYFLHPVEAVHGDLGCLNRGDILLAISNSGETEEVCRLLSIVKSLDVGIIALTALKTSTLGSQADVTIAFGRSREADSYGLAPTTSTTVMLALGDALALVVSHMRGFTPQQFAVFHPGGSLGRRLTSVHEVMRNQDEIRIASQDSTIREAFITVRKAGRRSGAVVIVDENQKLCGIFTDSDLARLLEQRRESDLDQPIARVMTHNPLTVNASATLDEALEILSRNKVSEVPVVDSQERPIGLIDITDVIGLIPNDLAS